MSLAQQSRVFWLTLPPLKAPARFAAARVALRSRIANPHASTFTLSTTPRGDGLWCAVVVPKGTATALNEIPEAARVPWSAGTVTWAASASPPFAISARGESVVLDAEHEASAEETLPAAVLQLVAQGGKTLSVVGAPHGFDEVAAHAQLGVPITRISLKESNALPLLAFSPLQRFDVAAQRSDRAIGLLAATFAAIAGLVHFGFAGWQFLGERAALKRTESAIATLAQERGQTAESWRSNIAKTAPWAARDSASSLLETTLPAAAATAERIKTVQFESAALSVEWSTLSDAERAAFESRIAASGAGVVASGARARVVSP